MKDYFLSLILKEYSSCLAYFCLLPCQAFFSLRGKPYVSWFCSSRVNIRKVVKMPSILLHLWIKVYISSLRNKELKTNFFFPRIFPVLFYFIICNSGLVQWTWLASDSWWNFYIRAFFIIMPSRILSDCPSEVSIIVSQKKVTQ